MADSEESVSEKYSKRQVWTGYVCNHEWRPLTKKDIFEAIKQYRSFKPFVPVTMLEKVKDARFCPKCGGVQYS